GSAMRVSDTAYTVPEVPRLTTGTPGASPRPSAAPMLSPVPGPTTASAGNPNAAAAAPVTVPAAASGGRTSGSRAASSAIASRTAGTYASVAVDHHAGPEASPRSVTPRPLSRSVR